mgnify:FL=1|jgi:stress response protein SCP2
MSHQGVREGQRTELGLSASLLGAGGKMWGDDAIIFYNAPAFDGSPGAVLLKGDLREGEDEEIPIHLARIDSRTDSIRRAISSFSERSPIDIGGVRGMSVRALDERSGEEPCRHDLTGDISGCTSIGMAAIRRERDGGIRDAIDEPIETPIGGLEKVVKEYCR